MQNGEALSDDRSFEMCNARHMYSLMVAREPGEQEQPDREGGERTNVANGACHR